MKNYFYHRSCLSAYERFGRAGLFVQVIFLTLRHWLKAQGPQWQSIAADEINSYAGRRYRVVGRDQIWRKGKLPLKKVAPALLTDDNYPMV